MSRIRPHIQVSDQSLAALRMLTITALAALSMAFLVAPVPALARVVDANVADVIAQVTPAVVNVSAWKLLPDTQDSAATHRMRMIGSGFITDASGTIITNRHVIEDATEINVTFSDGSTVPARLLAAAPMTDLAVLKVELNRPLPVVAFGDSDALRVGDTVLTIGNPLGIGMSVSGGMVSALNRDLMDTPFDSYIQTDAALNHGNSGGPLVDREGRVVGVNTALFSDQPNGGSIGLGFAIPANVARFIIGRLLDPNHPKPGWLGFRLQDMTPELTAALRVPSKAGVVVSVIEPGGPADQAGIHVSDVILGYGDARPSDVRAYMRSIVSSPIDQVVALTIWRDGKQQTIPATVKEWVHRPTLNATTLGAAARVVRADPSDLGLQLQRVTEDTRRAYALNSGQRGVLVTAVASDSEASDRGIGPGDTISMVQDSAVATPDDIMHSLEEAQMQHRPFIALLVTGKTGVRWIPLSVGAAR